MIWIFKIIHAIYIFCFIYVCDKYFILFDRCIFNLTTAEIFDSKLDINVCVLIFINMLRERECDTAIDFYYL